MEYDDFCERIEEILLSISKKEYPETTKILEEVVDIYTTYGEEDFFDILCKLFEADNLKEMDLDVAALVIEAFDEIEGEHKGDAKCNIGVLYYTGRCGDQDFDKAKLYYEEGDKLGCRQATENLGYIYYYGRNCDVDYKKAFHYFAKGAFDGHISSIYKIGDMYKNGYYVEKDELEAFRLYKYCDEKMTGEEFGIVGADVFIRLGDCYYNSIGVEKNLSTALYYYQTAERLYYDRVTKGDFLYRKQLNRAIEMQSKIREELNGSIPSFDWAWEDKEKK